MKIDISIIIPIYKGKKYLPKLKKMLKANYYYLKENTMEIIFVNDYPQEEISVDSFLSNTKVVLINNEKNLGIHKSRVKGLENSNGDYIIFLDQDDEIEDTYLIKQLDMIKENDADVIITNGFYMNSDGSKRKIYQTKKHLNCCKDIKCFINFTNPIISPGQTIIKRESIPKEWKECSIIENGADDYYLWLLMKYYEKKFYVNSELLYTHVYTGENTSSQLEKMKKSTDEIINMLKGKYSFFSLWKIKRRNMYYANYSNKIFHKICYFDVFISRKLYCLMHLV